MKAYIHVFRERKKKEQKKRVALVILRNIAVFLLPVCQFVDLVYKNKNFKKILYNKYILYI